MSIPGNEQFQPRAPSRAETAEVSLAELVTSKLRQALREGVLRSGQRIREVEVAEWLSVSRTPVREALHRLTEAGLFSQTPQGLVVVTLTRRDVIELYAVREVLVGVAASEAARHASPKDVEALKSILREMASANDPVDIKARNIDLYHTMYTIAQNAFLLKSLQGLTGAIDLLPGTTLAQPGRPRRSLDQLWAIVDAIGRHDAGAAEALAREHIRDSLQMRLAQMFGD
jgi:DNA-binding GntR family transcriptional regulator